MKPNQKKKGTSPGQLKLFWDELGVAEKVENKPNENWLSGHARKKDKFSSSKFTK